MNAIRTMVNCRIFSSTMTRTSHCASRSFASRAGETPFYGAPREPNSGPRSIQNRISLAIHHATAAFSDPTRADAVAALGEITGTVSLERIHQQMMNDETGRLILEERPIVSKATIPYERLISEAADDPYEPGITFGQAYGCFLKSHGFDPDERDEIKYIEDEKLAYVMLRYRQVCWRLLAEGAMIFRKTNS
jgi:ubiquinone biosynthesis protein COQ4